MTSSNKNWAQEYINGPLIEADPSDETGVGTSFRPTPPATTATPASPATPTSSGPRRLSKTNPFRDRASSNPFRDHASPKETSTTTTELGSSRAYPSPPTSTSPRLPPPTSTSPRNSTDYRREYLGSTTRPRRSSSLHERYPNDPSVHPLDQLAKEKATADRSKHVTKKHAVRPDTIDSLDNSGMGSYHHEGPYDATLFARNNSWRSSPVAAVASENQEALRATPHEKIVDSVQRHRPLDGVASYPPGTVDRNGQMYQYREGENMMTEENAGGGPYKRWAGLQYHPDDIKGKSEPSYSIEKALKEHNLNDREKEGPDGVEMTDRTRSRTGSATARSRNNSNAYRSDAFGDENGQQIGRSGSLSNKLKKRIGSLRRSSKDYE